MRARVAIVAQREARELGDLLRQTGHECRGFCSWAEFQASCDEGESWDLLLYDDLTSGQAPADLAIPGLRVGDDDDEVSFGSLRAMLGPVAGIATRLQAERQRRESLERLVEGLSTGKVLAGRCPVMRRLQSSISRAAGCEATVLIEGAPGTGKSLVARMIHCGSRRADSRLHVADCSTLEPAAMTRLLEDACSSSLVLEDIDQLPAAAQAVLVRHLKERSGPRAASVPRLLVTTSAHLPELVAKGIVREDLYYRLNAFPMALPTLREHLEDVGEIAETILQLASAQSGRAPGGLTPSAIVLLENMQWPGNVTQLESVVKRAHVMAAGAPIDREHVAASNPEPKAVAGTVPSPSVSDRDQELEVTEDQIRPFEEEEQYLLSRALRATKGNVRRAAQLLGIGRATLYRKIQQYKLRLQ
ncbi:MAG: sigma-54-dependent Fis family transcriptional regulator [Planctomycetes bacterium]|nr:sigma-54-dependent Fis family transcriptional regulator [Planctomycetota bacterium]